MGNNKDDLLKGTLDLLILKTLDLEAMHGWGIAERIQMFSGKSLWAVPSFTPSYRTFPLSLFVIRYS